MKDTHRYVIETANLNTALKEFAQMNRGVSIKRTDNDNEIRLDITDGSRKGILHLYHKNGGNYSHTEQGDWVNIAESCWSYLLTKYGMQLEHYTLPSIQNVEKVDFEAFLDCFKESEDYVVNEKEQLPKCMLFNVEISDSKKAKVVISYYNNKKMLIQGAVTKLLVDIVSECLEVIPQANRLMLDKILPPDRNGRSSLDAKIEAHINNIEPIKGGKIEKMIKTSLVLVNSGVVVEDYSCFSASILRALDATINGKISQVAGPVTSYGKYFEGSSACGYKIVEKNNPFPDDIELARLLADAYAYYHNHRHPIAHTDHQNVETTRILTYEEAVMEVKDTLNFINRIYEKW